MDGTTIENVRVFDGHQLSAPGPIFVDRGRIVDYRPTGGSIDGRGGTLLPGLIDTHVHIETHDELRECARWGVTTVLDMATPHPEQTLPLRHQDGVADLFSAGYPAVAPGATAVTKMGYPPDMAVAGPGDAPSFVQARVNDGVDYLKIIVEDPKQPGTRALDVETITALVDAAHHHGLKVIGHVITETAVQIAVQARIDVLTHVPVQAVVSLATARRVLGEGFVVSPTLIMMRGICDTIGRKPLLRALSALRVIPKMDYENARACTERFHRAGVPILAGTDANADPTTPFSPAHGQSLHEELRLLVGAGLSPVDALRAATIVAATTFGLDRGSVEPGRRADLLLVEGDPTADISATERIRHVWIKGDLVR
jgi:imidazolonepropionase-like amidohydrolase